MKTIWKTSLSGRLTGLARISLMIVISINGYTGLASGQIRIEDRNESYTDAAEINFNFGDSCERMAEVSEATIMELVKLENFEHWDRFCRASEPIDCDKFSYLFEGLGFLTPNKKDPQMCRFELLLEMNDWNRDQLRRNHGMSLMRKSDKNLRLCDKASTEPCGMSKLIGRDSKALIGNHLILPLFLAFFADL